MNFLFRTFLLIVFGTSNTSARELIHSLRYFYTESSEVPNLPEFVAVGLVVDNQIIYYDSNISRPVPKQDWMDGITEIDPQYWEHQTRIFIETQQTLKYNIEMIKQHLNQTTGVHVLQVMRGCEWNKETGEVEGFERYGYDGEDFISLDLKTETWTSDKQQADITKREWDSNGALIPQKKNYLTQLCPEWLKKYLNCGKHSLMRTVLPSVSLLQKTSSSPVSCHATGFYPNRAEMFWMKDGDEIHEGVEKGEILPNNDGTFQMSVELKPAEDASKYECVFQLSGADEDVVTKLEKTRIRTNKGNSTMMMITVVLLVVLVIVAAVVGFIVYKKKNDKRPPSPVENAEVQQTMLPKA